MKWFLDNSIDLNEIGELAQWNNTRSKEMTSVTKYFPSCPEPSLYHADGSDTSDCDHCYECPECGANELANEAHDGSCGYAARTEKMSLRAATSRRR